MFQFIVAFITGLTTGGLSCLAVQGGLLASSMAHDIELEIQASGPGTKPGNKKNKPISPAQAHLARPILLFLAAKIVAYTILGFILGALGSVIQLTPLSRAILMVAIGIFMIGNALRMLNVHPIFRYFSFEPPSFLTRYIRRTAKQNSSSVTPLFLGAMTIFIPCGVTQAMMALAIASGSALVGAGLMFAFTLGTSPVFFGVAYLASRLGTRLEKQFMRFAAVIILVLGIISINSGMNLLGAPTPITNVTRSVLSPSTVLEPTVVPTPSDGNVVMIHAKNNGYKPEYLQAKAGIPVELQLITDHTQSCSRAFVIPSLGIEELLPETGTQVIHIPSQPSGTIMQFTCSMGMYTGQIAFQ